MITTAKPNRTRPHRTARNLARASPAKPRVFDSAYIHQGLLSSFTTSGWSPAASQAKSQGYMPSGSAM